MVMMVAVVIVVIMNVCALVVEGLQLYSTIYGLSNSHADTSLRALSYQLEPIFRVDCLIRIRPIIFLFNCKSSCIIQENIAKKL